MYTFIEKPGEKLNLNLWYIPVRDDVDSYVHRVPWFQVELREMLVVINSVWDIDVAI